MAVAAGIAGSCGAVTAYALTPLIDSGFSAALITLSAAGVVGTAVYVAVARLVRLTELQQLVATTLAGIRTS